MSRSGMIIFALSLIRVPQSVLILDGPVTSTAGMSSLEPDAVAAVETVVVGVHSRVEGFDLKSGKFYFISNPHITLVAPKCKGCLH